MSDLPVRVTPEERSFKHELLLEEKPVSGLWVNDMVMRVGTCPVRMGGIGGVWTDEAHRMKGYSRRVLENSNVWMAENGFDCATLFGIPDYYHRFGYAPCLVHSEWEVRTRDAERAALNLEARPFTPEDLPALRGIYAAGNAARSGSIARDERTRWARKGSWYGTEAEGVVFADAGGEIEAYAVCDQAKDRVKIVEAGARQLETYGDVLRWAANRAVALRVENVTFLVPPDHPCAEFLTVFGARHTARYPRNGEGMGRILRLHDFLRKTLPEWTRRAAAAARPGQSLRLETDIGDATLAWNGEAVELAEGPEAAGTARLPQSRLMQLAMGYHSPDIVLSFPEVQAEGDLTLLRTLFPRQFPYMWAADHF